MQRHTCEEGLVSAVCWWGQTEGLWKDIDSFCLDFHVPCSTSLWKPRLSLIFVYARFFLGWCTIVTGVTRSSKTWIFFLGFSSPFSKGLSAAAWSITALFPQRDVWHAGCQIFKNREDAASLCLQATAAVRLRQYMFHAVYSINIIFPPVKKASYLPLPEI